MSEPSFDAELKAMQTLISVLEPLDREARTRVVDYVFGRLGLPARSRGHKIGSVLTASGATELSSPDVSTSPADIRSLGEEKTPKSATEMAAVVAYYLAELAPPGKRKQEVTAADTTKLFKQAGFPLPSSSKMTLVHAKNAGYLGPGDSRGAYELNPVGYN